jgi:ariadne-1
MVKSWSTKTESEGENAKFLAKFTKECPKCAALIHKDGGCQYMSCQQCHHKFCWICLGAFDHKNHACNKFKEEADKNSKRAELNKFMHFYTRYMTHEQSSQLEDKLMMIAEKTMEQLAEAGAAWIDVQYIKKATAQLMEARNMLKWTYVYGYYLPDAVNRDLFEWLQGDLEAETEKLSGLLEAKGEKDKTKIINSAEQVKKRVKNLLEGLMEGEITGGSNSSTKVYAASEFEKYEGWIYNAGQ